MNFQTSARSSGFIPGFNHVSIDLQYGIAVAANKRMASRNCFSGALGLALGKYVPFYTLIGIILITHFHDSLDPPDEKVNV